MQTFSWNKIRVKNGKIFGLKMQKKKECIKINIKKSM